MSYMFSFSIPLPFLDLRGFYTFSAVNMEGMFYNCPSLTSLDISNFNTSKVTNMGWMFCWCYYLTSLDISSFDFSNVKYISDMFDHCSSLTDLKFGKNLKVSLDLRACPLTHKSVLSVIKGLAKVKEQQTLTFSKEAYKALTVKEIEKATDKNWKINYFIR